MMKYLEQARDNTLARSLRNQLNRRIAHTLGWFVNTILSVYTAGCTVYRNNRSGVRFWRAWMATQAWRMNTFALASFLSPFPLVERVYCRADHVINLICARGYSDLESPIELLKTAGPSNDKPMRRK